MVAPLPAITCAAAPLTAAAMPSSSAARKRPRPFDIQSSTGTGPILACDHSGNCESPCSPMIIAWTLATATPASRGSIHRKRDESSTVPVENTRPGGTPAYRCATTVSTSAGFVTTRKTASGAQATRDGISSRSIAALVTARSSRDCPRCCFAPAVMTTTSDSERSSMSAPPDTCVAPAYWVPWARSSTSASTFAVCGRRARCGRRCSGSALRKPGRSRPLRRPRSPAWSWSAVVGGRGATSPQTYRHSLASCVIAFVRRSAWSRRLVTSHSKHGIGVSLWSRPARSRFCPTGEASGFHCQRPSFWCG